MNKEERNIIKNRLKNYQYKRKYTDEDLLKRIQNFYLKNGRIPIKREFNAWNVYSKRFGSWNVAIKMAGFETNPQLFSKKFSSRDGHMCDSFTEKIIDDWMYQNGIPHVRNVSYKGSRYTADFQIDPDILVEFFGLAGVSRQYNKNIEAKRKISQKLGYRLFEIYPNDIYPVNKLSSKLASLKIQIL